MKKSSMLLLLCLLTLPACGTGPTSVTPSPAASASAVTFANVISKRTLGLTNLGSLGGTASSGASSGSSTGTGTPAAAPVANAGQDVAVGRPMSGIASYYYGGGEFNNYVAVMAEENVLAGNSSGDLLAVYQQSILPLLKAWDPQARLIESRGNTHPELRDPNSYEYVYVPGLSSDKQMQLKPDWVFRFASTPRKETLTVYVTGKETRAYRVVWSEPNLAIARVKIPVQQAIEMARQALRSQSSQTDYPVYPDATSGMGSNATVVYDLPTDLNWTVSLGQQGDQLSYYLNVNYVEAYGKPGVAVVPSANPTTGGSTGSIGVGVAVPMPASAPVVTASPTVAVSASPGTSASSPPATEPVPARSATPADCQVVLPSYVYLSASVNLDAVTGKVLSVNRPVRYNNQYNYTCKGGYAVPDAGGVATTAPATPRALSTASP